MLFMGLFFVATLGVVLLFGSQGFLRSLSYAGLEAGIVADRDLVVEHDVMYEDQEATRLRIQARRSLARPVYRIHEDVSRRILGRFDQLFALLMNLHVRKVPVASAFLEIQAALPGLLKEEALARILAVGDLPLFLEEVRILITAGVSQGILSPGALDEPGKGIETLKSLGDKIQRQLWEPGELLILPDLNPGWEKLKSTRPLPENFDLPAHDLFLAVAEENAFYDPQETGRNIQRVDFETPPVRRQISQGEWLVRKDYVVTPEAMDKVKILVDHYGNLSLNRAVASLLFFLSLAILGFFLFHGLKIDRLDMPTLWTLAGLWLVHLTVATLVVSPLGEASGFWYALMPSTLMVILATMLAGERAGLFFALFLTLPILILIPQKAGIFVAVLFPSLGAPFVLRKVEKRMDLLTSGVWLGLIQGVFYLVATLIHDQDSRLGLGGMAGALVNGLVSSLLALGLLPVFEHLLNTPSQFRLAELADLNMPLLKRMQAQAPGTYAHSLNVAQLSEQAARLLGIDALLCRVGALYHDLGKLEQPDFFIENQKGVNKHDELKPAQSAAILKSHVKLGLEKARDLGLPLRVTDIISQHHGTGLISYFYGKAVEEYGEGRVNREDYRYPGPNPETKEAAVVLLADTVEAASRTLRNPSVDQVEVFVREMLAKRYQEGLLNHSGLTFSDLEIIKSTFVHVLSGQFHSRIDYPRLREDGK